MDTPIIDALDDPFIDPQDFDWTQAQIGEMTEIWPHPGETVAETTERMKTIAERHARDRGLHFLVRHDGYAVTIKRIKDGFATRLGEFLQLDVGEYTMIDRFDHEAERVERIAARLSRSGVRTFEMIDLDEADDRTWVRRTA